MTNPKAETAPKSRKPRNKDSSEQGIENTKKYQESVKSRQIDQIVERISNGEPLRQICRSDGMPSWRTVYDWIDADKEFAARFARARELGEEAISQECFAIADDGRSDMYLDADGRERFDTEHIQRSKLRIETRLKLLAKWNPKKWGEKLAIGGAPELPPVASAIDVSGLSTAALAEILKAKDAADAS
jgi:hypothetical protein